MQKAIPGLLFSSFRKPRGGCPGIHIPFPHGGPHARRLWIPGSSRNCHRATRLRAGSLVRPPEWRSSKKRKDHERGARVHPASPISPWP